MPDSGSIGAEGDATALYEHTHVHSIYTQIAPHFSQTRHKPWPLISQFLLSLSPGSVGLDIGCGNGKYLDVNPAIYIIGSDRSSSLIDIARAEKVGDKLGQEVGRQGGNDVVVADALNLPHKDGGKHERGGVRDGGFDFAISVAVVHHLSTRGRRVEGIRAVLRTLTAGEEDQGIRRAKGKAMIYVWALEQKGSRRGWDVGDEQDVMVPWVMKGNKEEGEKTFKRYYHLYRKGELEEDVRLAGGEVVEGGYESDNWWVVATRGDGG
ncbi:uncharacterized protein KY384_000353 [Bacidia gigantensis]|uniref:uncharacterized protein n=1 Tax=Bacidia gigantensis TaxID=2732470 RepID=UPI001D03DD86|nr:uncharacterized protein KY384_000353 [Bacidia gigantensis]KAG8526360.1 hypothetical protein KY384_000353 [Bacidia gigantensis]